MLLSYLWRWGWPHSGSLWRRVWPVRLHSAGRPAESDCGFYPLTSAPPVRFRVSKFKGFYLPRTPHTGSTESGCRGVIFPPKPHVRFTNEPVEVFFLCLYQSVRTKKVCMSIRLWVFPLLSQSDRFSWVRKVRAYLPWMLPVRFSSQVRFRDIQDTHLVIWEIIYSLKSTCQVYSIYSAGFWVLSSLNNVCEVQKTQCWIGGEVLGSQVSSTHRISQLSPDS